MEERAAALQHEQRVIQEKHMLSKAERKKLMEARESGERREEGNRKCGKKKGKDVDKVENRRNP